MPSICIDIDVLVTFTGLGSFLGLMIGAVIGYCARHGDYSLGVADGYTECLNGGNDPPEAQEFTQGVAVTTGRMRTK